MKKRQIIIILISLFACSAFAKKAPMNTFRFDDKVNPLSDNALIQKQIHELETKILGLRDSMPQNPLIKKIQEFRIYRLESEVENLSKEDSKDNN